MKVFTPEFSKSNHPEWRFFRAHPEAWLYLCSLENFKPELNSLATALLDFKWDDKYISTESTFSTTHRLYLTPGGVRDGYVPLHSKVEQEYFPTLQPHVDKLIRGLDQYLQSLGLGPTRCTSATIAAMPPGCFLLPHVDGYEIHRHTEKIHIPIVTNPQASNSLWSNGGSRLSDTHLEVGSAYVINNMNPHAAQNFGDNVRIHLLLDMLPYTKTSPDFTTNPYAVQAWDAIYGNSFFYKALSEQLFFNRDSQS